jgi:hypothetical protein
VSRSRLIDTGAGRVTCTTRGSVMIGAALALVRDFGRTPPSVQHLMDRFGISRATAYRWRMAWLDVFGVTP